MSSWVKVAKQSVLPQGEMMAISIADHRIAVYNIDGEFYATDDLCTHGNAMLSEGYLEDDVVECPLHGGRFNVKNGLGLGAPITCDLRTYPVRLADDDIEVDFDGSSS